MGGQVCRTFAVFRGRDPLNPASSRSPRAFSRGARDLAGIASVLRKAANFSIPTALCHYARDLSLG